ncbi:MAG: hypothetical protein ABIO60_00335 [Aquaticitalea sp.]
MSDKKHIDRLFQEKLKDFEVAPDDTVWDAINNQLHKKDERDRKVIPLWWKLAGVAALLALLLTVGIQLYFNGHASSTSNTIVDTEKPSSDKSNTGPESNSMDATDLENPSENDSKVANEDASNSGNPRSETSNNISNKQSTNNPSHKKIVANSDGNQQRIVTNTKQDSNKKNILKSSNSSEFLLQKNNGNTSKNAVAEVSKSDKNSTNLNKSDQQKESEIDKLIKDSKDKFIKDSKNDIKSGVTDATEKMENIMAEDQKEEAQEDNSIEDAIAEANTEEEKDEKEKKLNRWNISPNVAPVYFNSLGKGSSLDEQFVDNKKDGEVTMSYGVGGSYAINDRLKVRAGINKVDFGYNTDNVIAFKSIDPSGFARGKIQNVKSNSNSQNITYLSTVSLNRNITPEIINTKTKGAINQRFGFIEVPMELEYALLNNKLGVNVIGGFSTLIVDKNEIYSVIEGTETRIGEANNINDTSFSANFGLGVNYHISEKIKVNLEPTFKYQINTFSNSTRDFQPYFIGVYTGLSYKF